MSNQYQFRFASSRDVEDDESSKPSVGRYDIHPIELVVQSVLGEPLEILSNQLQTLHESQVILIARLKIIEEKLNKFQDQLKLDIDVKDTEERLLTLRKRLTTVLEKLKVIEVRVQRKISTFKTDKP